MRQGGNLVAQLLFNFAALPSVILRRGGLGGYTAGAGATGGRAEVVWKLPRRLRGRQLRS